MLDGYYIGVYSIAMVCSRKLLSILLAGLLMFANTACACASATDSLSDNDPHAHHQMQDGAAEVDNPLCPHQECDDCESLALAVTPERDGNSVGFAKPGLEDDLVWIDAATADIHRPLPLLARVGPPHKRDLRRAETPVRRADLLLE
jgi:hypothetical protein